MGKNKFKKLAAVIAASAAAFALSSCNSADYTTDGGAITTSIITHEETVTETSEVTDNFAL
jgi:hypothetical protein